MRSCVYVLILCDGDGGGASTHTSRFCVIDGPQALLIINKCNKEDYGTKADASLQIISYPLEGYRRRRTLRSLLYQPTGVIN